MNETSLEKRIKRHVVGRVREYFAITAPGLEEICRDEILSLPLSVMETSMLKGGVLFQGRFNDLCMANLCLSTATRILFRVETFTASDFETLERHLAEIPWDVYLHPGAGLGFSVTATHSRLWHKGAIAERAEAAIRRCIGPPSGPERPGQRIFIRAEDDRFTVSLDASGEPLYKRGIKIAGGAAPIRETMAAAILKAAGYTGREPLVDPMCGTGTFSLEAALITAQLPPGGFRTFAFMDWPAHRERRWEYLKREFMSRQAPAPEPPRIFASDKLKKACVGLERDLFAAGLSAYVTVEHRDFLSLTPADLAVGPGVVVINPPYGVRLGTPRTGRELFGDICRHLVAAYAGWRVALVCPDLAWADAASFGTRRLPIVHGGRRMNVLLGMIPGRPS